MGREAGNFHHWILFLLYTTSRALYIMHIVYASVFLRTEISMLYESANPLPMSSIWMEGQEKSNVQRTTWFTPCIHPFLPLCIHTYTYMYNMHTHKSTHQNRRKHAYATRHSFMTITAFTDALSGCRKQTER